MKRFSSIYLTIARTLSLCFALSVLGYLVYCAHRDAREAPPAADSEPRVFLPSSKAAPPPAPLDLKPTNKIPSKNPNKKGTQKKKKKQPDIFIPSSKSGVMRMPAPLGQDQAGAVSPAPEKVRAN